MTLYGSVEMGGTKTDVAVGTHPDNLGRPHRVPTTDPETTLAAVADFLAGHEIKALGVASFGPLNLDRHGPDFGTVKSTPKSGWSGVPVYKILKGRLNVPVNITSDVNGAALGEGRWGAANGMTDFVYVTVGTGIGVGVVTSGSLLGSGLHPEAGHIRVDRMAGDDYEGNCPYHQTCLEGMASGPALEARFGPPRTWAGNDNVTALASHYLARGMVSIYYTVVPERIVIGGGVTTLPGLLSRIRSDVGTLLADYPEEPDLDLLISAPGLGDLSALAGGLILAERAVSPGQDPPHPR